MKKMWAKFTRDTRMKSIKLTVMSKKCRQFFFRKNRDDTSLAALGDTNPSDATGLPVLVEPSIRKIL